MPEVHGFLFDLSGSSFVGGSDKPIYIWRFRQNFWESFCHSQFFSEIIFLPSAFCFLGLNTIFFEVLQAIFDTFLTKTYCALVTIVWGCGGYMCEWGCFCWNVMTDGWHLGLWICYLSSLQEAGKILSLSFLCCAITFSGSECLWWEKYL